MVTSKRTRKLLKHGFDLKIKDQKWTVRFAFIADYPDGRGCVGLCDKEKRRIWIHPEQSAAEMRLALDHEILHARNWSLSEKAVGETETLLAIGRATLNALLR